MTRNIYGRKSGEIVINNDIQFHDQWVLSDKFLVYTWFRPESKTDIAGGGISWRAQYSNKTIFRGNFSYKVDTFLRGTITEIALVSHEDCRILPSGCFGSTRSQVRILSPRLTSQQSQ